MAWKFSLSNSPYKQKSNIKLVLIKLCDNASDEGYCWPSMGRIAKECELSKRSVVDQVGKLKELGLIAVEHRFKDNEQTSNGYQINIELLSRGELLAPPSEGLALPQCTDCTQNHHRTINESSITDSFHSEKRSYLIEELDEVEFKHCHEVMSFLNIVNSQPNDKRYFTGKLTLEEWSECEDAMDSVDYFDHCGYVAWWTQNKYPAMNKYPSLPNMLCDVKGIPFNQFYDTTFMQEWD